jgi:hypothetical protein
MASDSPNDSSAPEVRSGAPATPPRMSILPAPGSGAPPGPSPLPNRPPEPAQPDIALGDFLSGSDVRLRDLLAFGMAVEAARPLGPDGVDGFRRKAEAELEAHAFRLLHNQAETIRRQAMDDQLARLPRGLSFSGVIAANLAALVLGGVLLLLAWLAAPGFFADLSAQLAQFLARFSVRS